MKGTSRENDGKGRRKEGEKGKKIRREIEREVREDRDRKEVRVE